MIELTGTIKGEVYEDKRLSPKELIKMFDLPVNGAERIVFRLNEGNRNVVAKNMADGKPRFPVRQGLISTFSAMYEGSSVQVRYYERKAAKSKADVRYFPEKIYFDGIQTALNLNTSLERAVFMILFPWCKESPFRPSRKSPVYQIHDRVKNATAKLEDSVKFSEAMSSIMDSGDDLIRQIAYGIKVNGHRVSHEDAKFPATARMALLDIARKHPKETYEAFHSTAVRIAGAVIDAKERKLITSSIKAGKVVWEYADALGGDKFAEFKNQGDAVSQLIKHLSDVNAWAGFTSRVFNDEDSPEPVDLGELDNDALIKTAVEAHKLALHPTDGKVYMMDENSQFDGKALMITSGAPEDWKTELAAKMSNIQRNRLIKRLSK